MADRKVNDLLAKALEGGWLSTAEGVYLFQNAPAALLCEVAHQLRSKVTDPNVVTWIIDRNCNTTNVCVANCKFCNFYRVPGHPDAYITGIDEYKRKIEETFALGGEQLLLQGGHHPELGLDFYTGLFRKLKSAFPDLKLHALGPPEVAHIAKLGGYDYKTVLIALREAGLDSLPGAGAEILNDRVRKMISNGKCSAKEWLNVMRAAHQLGISTSATMMFGHVEKPEERFEHLCLLRQVQSEKPEDADGFNSFIAWPFQDEGTTLQQVKKVYKSVGAHEYLRMVAMSRIMLPNIPHIGASWLTVGRSCAQLCLHSGADDMGSIMIEENVVSAAGAPHRFDAAGIQECIREAGFEPRLRNQKYEYRSMSNANIFVN